jgi:hypothetical protein
MMKSPAFCHPEPCPELDSGLFRDLGLGDSEIYPEPISGQGLK